MDEVFPVLGAKLEKAASEHPSFHFVDLSLMFIHEQAFADLAHLKYELIDRSVATELLAGRMADEIVKVLYDGQSLPNWRELHVEGTPHNWDEQGYLAANPDVAALVAEGKVQNGFEHYRSAGFFEFRVGGFPAWNESEYLADNPDVVPLIGQGLFASGYEHYVRQGKAEGRRKGLGMRWIEETYLLANPDVVAAVAAGKFKSGEEHFMKSARLKTARAAFPAGTRKATSSCMATSATPCSARCFVQASSTMCWPASKRDARSRWGFPRVISWAPIVRARPVSRARTRSCSRA